MVRKTQDKAAVIDSTGLCMFTRGAWNFKDYAEQIDVACGGGWTGERLVETGERIYNMERQFNIRAGFTATDDTLPKRFFTEPAKRGAGKDWISKVPEMLPEYYEERGWDPDGVPTRETLQRLKLI